MDMRSFVSQADTFESSSHPESYRLFTYYHPQYQPDCPTYQDGQHASFTLDGRECLGESAYYTSSTSLPTTVDPSGGYTMLTDIGSPEHDKFFTQHAATIPPGKMSRHSELMPHVVAHKTAVSLRQDARVATKPQPCVSPALCQGHADLPECAEYGEELDCPGEPAADGEDVEAESSDEGEHNDPHPPPPPSPYSIPSPSSSDSSSSFCYKPPRKSRVVRSARTQNRYSPIGVNAPSSREGKSAIQRMTCGLDEEPKKPKKRREAVNLACHYCRKRKIACRQPPQGSADRTCNQCRSRGMVCEYPTKSRRGVRPGSASHKPVH